MTNALYDETRLPLGTERPAWHHGLRCDTPGLVQNVVDPFWGEPAIDKCSSCDWALK